MALTDRDREVLRILSVQAPDYLSQPDASAFVADGLTDPAEVEAALRKLCDQGLVDEFEDVQVRWKMEPALDDGGREVLSEGGQVVLRHALGENGEFLTEPDLDENGREIVMKSGWQISAAGRKQLP